MTPITQALSRVSEAMSDGYQFVKLRFQFEQWATEAAAGNADSAQLVDLLTKFDRLITVITRSTNP